MAPPSLPGLRMASQIGQKEPLPTLDGTTTMKPLAAKSASLARVANFVPFSLVPLKPMKSGRGPVKEAGGRMRTNSLLCPETAKSLLRPETGAVVL